MNEDSQNSTRLLVFLLLFCLACSLLTFAVMGPEAPEAPEIILFPHPENAS